MALLDRFRPTAVTLPWPLRATQMGTLEGLAALRLSGGTFVRPGGELDTDPVAWISRGAELAHQWTRLAQQFPATGWWPLATRGRQGDLTDPWLDGLVDGPVGEPEAGRTRETTPGAVEVAVPSGMKAMLLVPVWRPADVPWRLGWRGALGAGVSGVELTRRLRGWADRFGAVPTRVDADSIGLAVTQPPSDPGVVADVHKQWDDLGVTTVEDADPAADQWVLRWGQGRAENR